MFNFILTVGVCGDGFIELPELLCSTGNACPGTCKDNNDGGQACCIGR